MLYAACGLVLSLAAHILSFFGIQFGGMPLFIGLHVGIFPLWIPVVFIAQKMMGGVQRKDFWKVALSGCPVWMRYMTYGFFIYAVVNFAIFIILVSMHPPAKGGGAPPPEVLHGFSGHWMAFYSAAFAILYAAARTEGSGPRCANGHVASPNAAYCTRCGQSVVRLH